MKLIRPSKRYFRDNFNQTDGLVGPAWATVTASPNAAIRTVSNQLKITGVGNNVSLWKAPVSPNQFAQIDITASVSESYPTLFLRGKTNLAYGGGYAVGIEHYPLNTYRAYIYNRESATSLYSAATVAPQGVRAEVRGNQIKMFSKQSGIWVLLTTVTDTTPIAAGSPGVYMHAGVPGTVCTCDNFICGDL